MNNTMKEIYIYKLKYRDRIECQKIHDNTWKLIFRVKNRYNKEGQTLRVVLGPNSSQHHYCAVINCPVTLNGV